MPILNLQQSMTEVGRVRLGVKVRNANGRERPAKLDRLRFTSPRRVLIEKIAELYGGKVEPWQPPKGSQQWQVVTDTAEVPVLIPPQDPSDSQWYEMWSAGGCLRRCDGQQEKISKSNCLCDPAARDCKMHTRLRVMLEDIPGLGAWRIDTGSYYAAVELPGVAALLAMAQGAIPGRLVLDQRTVTRQVDGQPKTFNFAVPTLHVDELTPKQLMSGRVQELVAARNNAAVAGDLRVAIAATVDFGSLIDAAKNVDALYEVANQVKASNGGQIPADLLATLEARRDALNGAKPPAEVVVVQPSDIVSADDVDVLWSQILAASPWNTGEELEANFCKVVGRSSADATAEDMRRFLAAIEQASVGAPT
ncbi:hypothetical protein ACH4T9_12365 [Micromonospora sp. NPDC020750]|uniref:recombination directionality factor n=1 Tax=unclassified Micromonospora TaxID=2617518 RepID=UPI00379FEA2F